MQPKFSDKWEHTDRPVLKNYRNDSGILQFHPQLELYFIDEGEMEISINAQTALLKAGEFAIVFCFDTHAYKTPTASRSSMLIIPLHLCEKFLAITKGLHPRSPFITDRAIYDQIKHYFELLKEAEEQPLLQYGYLQVILGILTASMQFEEAEDSLQTDLATRLLSYISQNYKSELSPSDVADALGYSHGYLSRLFHKRFGITMVQYITNTKLKNALAMMNEAENTITECALESGFSSVNSFYRAFSKEFGCSPSAYMKKIHQ